MQCVAEASGEERRVEAADLQSRFVRGEAEAFGEIVEMYGQRVARLTQRLIGYRGEVDDLVQDVFLAALEHRRRFRGESTLWTWLTSITVNRCRSHWRRERVRRLGAKLPGGGGAAAPADRGAIEDEAAGKIRAAVGELPWRQREVIVLHYFEEMPIAEIGRVLGEGEGAVKVRLHRARLRLREELGDEMMEK